MNTAQLVRHSLNQSMPGVLCFLVAGGRAFLDSSIDELREALLLTGPEGGPAVVKLQATHELSELSHSHSRQAALAQRTVSPHSAGSCSHTAELQAAADGR